MKNLMALIGCMLIFSCAGKQPDNTGVQNGKLAVCPDKPNCVSSQAADEKHAIAPLAYQGEKAASFDHLKNVINSYGGATIVEEKDNYLHVEFKSAVMGFVDDVEFYFPKENIIEVRSASRLGYSDFGVNRKRMEQLRKLFTASPSDANE
jgi:uncharacterized protein (DUF1499 family)